MNVDIRKSRFVVTIELSEVDMRLLMLERGHVKGEKCPTLTQLLSTISDCVSAEEYP